MDAAPPRAIGLLLAGLAGCLLSPAAALAHKLDLTVSFPADRPGRVQVAANFDDGDPAPDVMCVLLDPDGAEIGRDRTDPSGLCHFTLPPPGRYTAVADDGDGHRVKLAFEVTDGHKAAEEATTATSRWVGLAGGLALIAMMAVVLRRLRRRRPPARPMPGT